MKRSLLGLLMGALLAVGPESARAATEYQCGAGKPNKATKKCDCPSGKVESTDGKGVSRCVDAPVKPPPPVTEPTKPTVDEPAVVPPSLSCMYANSDDLAGRYWADFVDEAWEDVVWSSECGEKPKSQRTYFKSGAFTAKLNKATEHLALSGEKNISTDACWDAPRTSTSHDPAKSSWTATCKVSAESGSTHARAALCSTKPGLIVYAENAVVRIHKSGTSCSGTVARKVTFKRQFDPVYEVAPTGCPTGMAAIPGGAFNLIQSKDPVVVAGFCLDRTETTVSAYAACVEAGKCTEPVPHGGSGWPVFHNWKHPEKRLTHPVNGIDKTQASALCAFLQRRLPSVAELQWASRGGNLASKYPWGAAEATAKVANLCDGACATRVKEKMDKSWAAMFTDTDGFPETAPVGSFGVNGWQIADLAGNVAEWTNEGLFHGGSWLTNSAYAVEAEATSAWEASAATGVRCAKSP